ncbi:hypothetical protein Cyrtocomes_00845 [Candidatus Cyrtobacter comes]|uniref:Uncharacterized protein n=1 Tax=Candidatus Cyrtobacter comes TaxID=675776 RepID=A0ABU5L8L2_9RICK|nr:hypothetical protein [Candidatus Cyrtobacter comes]MDZ5762461.1 hypothetical protein [Candidatus Cyrtobacter comes]
MRESQFACGPAAKNKDGSEANFKELTQDIEVTIEPYKKGHVDYVNENYEKIFPHAYAGKMSESQLSERMKDVRSFKSWMDIVKYDYKVAFPGASLLGAK